MAKYINKDCVVAEIEKLIDKGKYHEEYDCYPDGKMSWHNVVKEYNIKRWAYIEDLLAL